jgi:ubiquinone/menaquinone biosynthesis C-methylase UbiE
MKRENILFYSGLTAATLIAAGWQLYACRPRERIPSHESMDDLEVVKSFNWVATMLQMRLLRWFVVHRAAKMARSGEAVDLGCGPGHLVIELARQAPGLHVMGIDLSDEMLAQAEGYAQRSSVGDRVSFRKGDAQHIPLPDGSLDLAVSTLSLHHWSDPVAVLDEVARVLRSPEAAEGRPGGSFLIFDLRRDMTAPFWLLLWFATRFVVPVALRRVNEPLASRNAAYTPQEAARLAKQSRLSGWRITRCPLWLTIEGTK